MLDLFVSDVNCHENIFIFSSFLNNVASLVLLDMKQYCWNVSVLSKIAIIPQGSML